jgi:DNA-binding NarL/FixJ family response regulator
MRWHGGPYWLLGSRGDLEVCGQATIGREAIQKFRDVGPDLLILDLTFIQEFRGRVNYCARFTIV